MTVNELSQIYYLNREIEKDKAKLESLRARRGLHSQTIDDMPHGSGPKDSKDAELTAEIIDLEEIIKAKLVIIQRERNRLMRYISDIPNSFMRQIFTARFVELMTWEQVAEDIGPGRTGDSVKIACYRYLKRERAGFTDRQNTESARMAEEYELMDSQGSE